MNEKSFSQPYYHINTESPSVENMASLPSSVKAQYNDGGEAQIKVKWNFDSKSPAPDGGYSLTGTLECDAYPNPFIMERADPYVIKHGDKYYFTACIL